jgi:hypothetical protein
MKTSQVPGRGASRSCGSLRPLRLSVSRRLYGCTLQQVCHASSFLVCALPCYDDHFDHQRLYFYPGCHRVRFLVRGRGVHHPRQFSQMVVLKRPPKPARPPDADQEKPRLSVPSHSTKKHKRRVFGRISGRRAPPEPQSARQRGVRMSQYALHRTPHRATKVRARDAPQSSIAHKPG